MMSSKKNNYCIVFINNGTNINHLMFFASEMFEHLNFFKEEYLVVIPVADCSSGTSIVELL